MAALATYLQGLRNEGKGLPARGGKVSTSAIALAAGVDRQSLYKNPHCRALLEAAAQEMGLAGIESRDVSQPKDDGKDQRVQTLEAQVASLTEEVHGLRAKLAQFGHIEAHGRHGATGDPWTARAWAYWRVLEKGRPWKLKRTSSPLFEPIARCLKAAKKRP